MANISEIDLFFQNHPLQEQYFNYSAAERAGAAAVAERDLLAVLQYAEIPAARQDDFTAAVAEQTLFLLLNPEYLTGSAAPVLGARPAALLKPLDDAVRHCPLRLNRG